MIVRNGLGEYVATKTKRIPPVERRRNDHDLRWVVGDSTHSVYVLDAHEWFDPQTSTHYSEAGVSRHAMFGPGVVTTTVGPMQHECHEAHVNDPKMWAWVRRSIAEGSLSAETLAVGVNDESDVVVA